MRCMMLLSPVEVDDAYENAEHKGNGHRYDQQTSKHGRKKDLGREPKKRGKRRKRGRGANAGRVPMWGGVSRTSGKSVVKPLSSLASKEVFQVMDTHIAKGSRVITDEQSTYWYLGEQGYEQDTVEHAAHDYAHGDVYTNTVEGLWSLWRPFSRPHRGFSQEHLPQWTGWFSWTRNNRETGLSWIVMLVHTVFGVPGDLLRLLTAKGELVAVYPLFSYQGSACTLYE